MSFTNEGYQPQAFPRRREGGPPQWWMSAVEDFHPQMEIFLLKISSIMLLFGLFKETNN